MAKKKRKRKHEIKYDNKSSSSVETRNFYFKSEEFHKVRFDSNLASKQGSQTLRKAISLV